MYALGATVQRNHGILFVVVVVVYFISHTLHIDNITNTIDNLAR